MSMFGILNYSLLAGLVTSEKANWFSLVQFQRVDNLALAHQLS